MEINQWFYQPLIPEGIQEEFENRKSIFCLTNEMMFKVLESVSLEDLMNGREVCGSFKAVTEAFMHHSIKELKGSPYNFYQSLSSFSSRKMFYKYLNIVGDSIPALYIKLDVGKLDHSLLEKCMPIFSNVKHLYVETEDITVSIIAYNFFPIMDDNTYLDYVKVMERIIEIVSQRGHILELLSIRGIPIPSINLAPFINLKGLSLIYSVNSFQAMNNGLTEEKMSSKITPWSVHNQSELHQLKSVSIFNGKYSNDEDDSSFFINHQSLEQLHLFQSGFPLNLIKEMTTSMNKLTCLTVDCCLDSSLALLKGLAGSTNSTVRNNLEVLYVKSNLFGNQSMEVFNIIPKFINLSELGFITCKVSSSGVFKEIAQSCIQLKHLSLFRCEIIVSPENIFGAFVKIISKLESFSLLDCTGLWIRDLLDVLLEASTINSELIVIIDVEQFITPFNIDPPLEITPFVEVFLYAVRESERNDPILNLYLMGLTNEFVKFKAIVCKQVDYFHRLSIPEEHPSRNLMNDICSLFYMVRLQGPLHN